MIKTLQEWVALYGELVVENLIRSRKLVRIGATDLYCKKRRCAA